MYANIYKNNKDVAKCNRRSQWRTTINFDLQYTDRQGEKTKEPQELVNGEWVKPGKGAGRGKRNEATITSWEGEKKGRLRMRRKKKKET